MRASEGGGCNSAELWMRGREAGCRGPGGYPIRPLPGTAGPLGVWPVAYGAAVTQPAPGPGATPHQLLLFVLVPGILPLLAARLLLRASRGRRWGLLGLYRCLIPAALLHLHCHCRPAARAPRSPRPVSQGASRVAHGAPPSRSGARLGPETTPRPGSEAAGKLQFPAARAARAQSWDWEFPECHETAVWDSDGLAAEGGEPAVRLETAHRFPLGAMNSNPQ